MPAARPGNNPQPHPHPDTTATPTPPGPDRPNGRQHPRRPQQTPTSLARGTRQDSPERKGERRKPRRDEQKRIAKGRSLQGGAAQSSRPLSPPQARAPTTQISVSPAWLLQRTLAPRTTPLQYDHSHTQGARRAGRSGPSGDPQPPSLRSRSRGPLAARRAKGVERPPRPATQPQDRRRVVLLVRVKRAPSARPDPQRDNRVRDHQSRAYPAQDASYRADRPPRGQRDSL